MVKVNMMTMAGCVAGALLCIFWGFLWLWSYGYGSGDSQVTDLLRAYAAAAAILFIIGTVVSFVTPLGSLIQAPVMIILPIVDWHSAGFGPETLLVAASAFATGTIFLSMFVQAVRSTDARDNEPLPRLRTWTTAKGERQARTYWAIPPVPKYAKIAMAVALAASLVGATASYVYFTTEELSTIEIEVMVDGLTYGTSYLEICLDGELVWQGTLEPPENMTEDYGRLMHVRLFCPVTAGTHTVETDFSNTTEEQLDGISDLTSTVRVLPYTTEIVYVLFGYAFV